MNEGIFNSWQHRMYLTSSALVVTSKRLVYF